MASADRFTRPYLVNPKLIEQPTWGGQYIASSKGWGEHDRLKNIKIGQSYELFSGSNLSLADSSDHPSFVYELTDRDAVAHATSPANSIALTSLISEDAAKTLGPSKTQMDLLIKYTQALGNSFQVHLKDGVQHAKFKPKPESWYFFEPGLITLGVKPGIDWDAYERACYDIEAGMKHIGHRVMSKELTYDAALSEIEDLLRDKDPWGFVNTLPVAQDELVDLSAGGIHHSWEEDSGQAPRGNILYELQVEALDDISTFRSFDKGKLGSAGQVRSLQVDEYFKAIDRSESANDPRRHIRKAEPIETKEHYSRGRLMSSKYYNLDKLDLLAENAGYTEEDLSGYRHLFVKEGCVAVTAGHTTVTVGQAHSCFIPAGASQYRVVSLAPSSQVLVSY